MVKSLHLGAFLCLFALGPASLEGAIRRGSEDWLHIHPRRELASAGAVQYVCVFDVDRTLTAAQESGCSNVAKTSAVDNAYGGNGRSLVQGTFALGALQGCASKGYGISIATHGPGCSTGQLNGEASKFKPDCESHRESCKRHSEWQESESKTLRQYQCGPRAKNEMMKNIMAYWSVPYGHIVFYDDQQPNLDVIKNDPVTKDVITVLASADRPSGDDCTKVNSRCCGLSELEFTTGLSRLAANGGSSSPTPTSGLSPSSPPSDNTTPGGTSGPISPTPSSSGPATRPENATAPKITPAPSSSDQSNSQSSAVTQYVTPAAMLLGAITLLGSTLVLGV